MKRINELIKEEKFEKLKNKKKKNETRQKD